MTSYRYLTSPGFCTTANLAQVRTNILAQITDVTLTSLTSSNNIIIASFPAQLSLQDAETLNTIITSLDTGGSTAIVPYVYPGSGLMKVLLNGSEQPYVGNQGNEIIIAKGPQAQYSSIKAAIAAHQTPNTVFCIYPGTYIEVNPIVVPAGCYLKGQGLAQTTIIVAANPNADLIVLSAQAGVFKLCLNGAYGTGSRGIYIDGTQSGGRGLINMIEECLIVDCNIGIEVDGKNLSAPAIVDMIILDKVFFKALSRNNDKALYCHRGGIVQSISSELTGVPYLLNVTPGFNYNYGMYCTDLNSKITSITYLNYGCPNAIFVDNSGYIQLVLANIYNSGTGLTVGPNGTTSSLTGSNINVINSTTHDLLVQSTDANINFNSDMLNDAKFVNPNNVTLSIKYNTLIFNEYTQTMIGDNRFGTPFRPTKSSFGQGEYITSGCVVMSNTDFETGTWTDVSAQANDPSDPYFNLFSGQGAGNCCYIGNDQFIPGIKAEIVTPCISNVKLSDVTWEYWGGSNWITFHIMQSYFEPPYYTEIRSILAVFDTFNIRFGLTSETPFVLQTLNGYTKYWVRIRVINTLPSIPVCNYFRIHVSSKLIGEDGFSSLYGDARVVKTISNGLDISYPSNSTMGNQELYVAQDLSIAKTHNVFRAGNLCRLGYKTILPFDIDSSFPFKLEFAFIGDNSLPGDVSFTLRRTYTVPGNKVYHNLADAPAELPSYDIQNIVVPITAADTDTRALFVIPIFCIDVHPSTDYCNIMWLSLERDATGNDSRDTYVGNISIILSKGYHISCYASGTHITGF